jgi:hypothetical protein
MLEIAMEAVMIDATMAAISGFGILEIVFVSYILNSS